MRHFIYIIIILGVFFYSCDQPNKNRTLKENDSTNKLIDSNNKLQNLFADTTFSLEYFISIPDTINYCLEVIGYDKVKKLKDNYIFVSSTEGHIGVIKSQGKIIYLNKDDSQSIAIENKFFTTVYKGAGWTVIIRTKTSYKEEEILSEKGTMEIIYNGKKQTINIIGEIEC